MRWAGREMRGVIDLVRLLCAVPLHACSFMYLYAL